MANPRKTRGEYRPIYEALVDGPDYRKLTPTAKLCLVTIKLKAGPMGMRPWAALADTLAEMTGEKLTVVRTAVKQLLSNSWIEYEDGIVWLIRGMEFEPSVSHGVKHRAWLERMLRGFPRAPIVDRFRAHYAAFFGASDGAEGDRDSDRVSDTPCDRVSDTPADTTSPTTFPVPLTTPPPRADAIVSSADGAHRQALANAANAGITAQFGEQINVVRWDRRTSIEAASDLEAAGVPVAFAERTIFTIASTTRPSDGTPATSLRYFTHAVVTAWAREVAKAGRETYQRPTGPATSPDDGIPDEWAIDYARKGEPSWQAYCDDRGIAWRAA